MLIHPALPRALALLLAATSTHALAQSAPATAAAPTASPAPVVPAAVVAARDAALTDRDALSFVEDLTTEVGARPAATEAEARARRWAAARLTAMGFTNVRVETYQMPSWVRGEERAEITAPYPQRLAITALGRSAGTPAEGLTLPVVGFANLAAFDASREDVRGKIVYIGHAMHATQDGSSYGAYGPVRFVGPDHAARRGAAAIVIRSVGTDWHRNPHTGVTSFREGTTPIPAGALSNPDADNLERMLARANGALTMHLTLTPQNRGMQESGNVIGEIAGTDPSAGIVLAACHLDSWDLATGAVDDGAGCAIITAAARRAAAGTPPRRTIRVLFAGAEEVGGNGARDYWARHQNERHAATLESDFGADRVWRVDFKLPTDAAALGDRIAAALLPIGVVRGRNPANGGADNEPLVSAGVPVVDLQQDGTDYFNLHHTPDDTFDKINPAALAQNVAAWTATLRLLADAPEALSMLPHDTAPTP